jgi:hypothetical protein
MGASRKRGRDKKQKQKRPGEPGHHIITRKSRRSIAREHQAARA